MRDIAAKAGVSHALVHSYLGTKEDVFKAVLTRDQERILRAAEGLDDLSSAVPAVIAYMLGPGRPYATLIAHAAVHGMPWDVEVQGHASRRLVELAGSEAGRGRSIAAAGLDHRFVVACVISLVLGWIALDSWMPHAVGLDELDEAKVAAGLTAVALRMLGE